MPTIGIFFIFMSLEGHIREVGFQSVPCTREPFYPPYMLNYKYWKDKYLKVKEIPNAYKLYIRKM